MSAPLKRAWRVWRTGVCLVAMLAAAGACGGGVPPEGSRTTPVYNPQTGRLEQIVSDRNGDGKTDTWAYMDGTRIVRVELDRNGDGTVDRWEYYQPSSTAPGGSVIERAEEANGTGQAITRREFYDNGVIARVEDDTDGDGRPDKWERYTNGHLVSVDLDLLGKGFPNRRLVYDADGNVAHVESDDDGDGTFEPVTPEHGPGGAPKGAPQ